MMKEPLTEDSDAAPTLSSSVGRQTKTALCTCKICGASARYSYYGAVVCHSCKMFFKRNAENRKSALKCLSGNKCDITMSNRQTCASCRLAKCFINGMCIEMIRSSRCKKNKRNEKRKLIIHSIPLTSTTLITPNKKYPFDQIPTLNLLKLDQSTLSTDQWNLVSNLVHCFDENSGYAFVERFIEEQNRLPLKLRFKYSSVNHFITSMMGKVQLVFERNRDFLSLSQHDRTILLESTVEYTATIGGMFLLRQARLLDDLAFFQSAEMIFPPSAMIFAKRIIDQFDSDDTFIKLIFAILAFSTINYTVYRKNTQTNLTNIKAILPIQDMYTDLAWRYLLHKYGHNQAVIRFSNLLRCLFSVSEAIIEARGAQQFTDIIDYVVEQTAEALID
ncbi:unnamed protein product [Rotaria sp. Silwood2]|nr:unnamed protein product [Rotaria sp. Silwood2]CAF3076783.1 unnamed protein product [Rotaria sp. Silwood2]CAF3409773.1 unnamed protein product [Rotaria sp. Silwood2]CAF4344190.1 unnamed protein product [Rotaria sp. Silwood2]CAF4406720.1 unnamed protein product [Rotaria sp. Silwood2]